MTGTAMPCQLHALRVPITGPWPETPYLAVFNGTHTLCQPTEREARMLASFIGYLRSHYTGRQQQAMLAEPFDTDPALAPYVFHKRGPGDWCYRRAHWTEGPFWWPNSPTVDPLSGLELPLADLLDRVVKDRAGAWAEWATAHPDAFGED
jgi:hypothetical protein